MAAQRIRAARGLPRCKSEGTLIELSKGFSETSFNDVKVPSPSALLVDNPTPFGNTKVVIAIKDYCPTNFTMLKFSKGDHLYVLDTSGGEWWYAHNTTEIRYIPSSYVQPLNYRNSTLSDSGMIDNLPDSPDEVAKEMDLLGGWTDDKKVPARRYSNNPFWNGAQTNPFLNGNAPIMPSVDELNPKSTVDLLLFDTGTVSFTESSSATTNSTGNIFDEFPVTNGLQTELPFKRDNPFFRSKCSYSLSELSIFQAKSDTPTSSSFFTAGRIFELPSSTTRSWHALAMTWTCSAKALVGARPKLWRQTLCASWTALGGLCSSLTLASASMSLRAKSPLVRSLLDPPLELNSDRSCSITEQPGSENLHHLGDEMGLQCLRSDSKEGPYVSVLLSYSCGDTVQAQLHNLEPCMYVVIIAHAPSILYPSTVWDFIHKKVTVALHGPKHIHPSFKMVVTIFGHNCAPKTLLVSEVTRQAPSPVPVALQLWGKHQFILPRPQNLKVCMFSNMMNYEVRAREQAKVVQGFQLKLGKVSCLIFPIASQNANKLSDIMLQVQVKDDQEAILTQFCIQTPQPPPKSAIKPSGQRRFLKNEVGKIIPSPFATTTKYLTFQDCPVSSLKFGKLLKTVVWQNKNHYLLEYKKGDGLALLSEERVRLWGQLWTKEWYIGYYQGRVVLVHAKNMLVVGRAWPSLCSGPKLSTSVLLEQILWPCKFLTYIYTSMRTLLMENISSWCSFADALGYMNLPLTFFSRVGCLCPGKAEGGLQQHGEQRTEVLPEGACDGLTEDGLPGPGGQTHPGLCALTTAVEVAHRWRELAEKLAKVSQQQMDAYESPHQDRNGVVDSEAMWKTACDFLLTWSHQIGDSYRDVIQELHLGLDKMKNPITKRWKHLTGTLILVNS
ncbi:SH3 domain-binding protein 4, partial [Saguinus oedipus]